MSTISRVLVAGSGAVGLRTAMELARRNVNVVLASAAPSLLDTTVCSQGAGGFWMPVHVQDERVDRWALQTLEELYELHSSSGVHGADSSTTPSSSSSQRTSSLVEIVPAVVLLRNHTGPKVEDFVKNANVFPEWTRDLRLQFQHLTVEMLAWQNTVKQWRIPSQEVLTQAGYLHAWTFYAPVVNSPKMLEYMVEELTASSSSSSTTTSIQTNVSFQSLSDMVRYAQDQQCDAVVNCTGMGAAKLCNDANLVPGRGVIFQFDRATAKRRFKGTQDAVMITDQAPWGSETMPAYLIPRNDRLVVGGTMLQGDTETSIRENEREHILRNAHAFGIDTSVSKPVAQWTGFRPYRKNGVRLEVEYVDGMKLVHNYGHGGSGFTINVGTAKDCADLVLA